MIGVVELMAGNSDQLQGFVTDNARSVIWRGNYNSSLGPFNLIELQWPYARLLFVAPSSDRQMTKPNCGFFPAHAACALKERQTPHLPQYRHRLFLP